MLTCAQMDYMQLIWFYVVQFEVQELKEADLPPIECMHPWEEEEGTVLSVWEEIIVEFH